MHYASSGLENPATNFLMAVFTLVLLNGEKPGSTIKWKFVFTLGIITAMALLNRVDTGAFFGIALAYFALKYRKMENYGALILSMLPLVAWFIFSLIYYGFLFPNTAFAKLNTGIPTIMLLRQGVIYIIDSMQNDPITLFVITSAIAGILIYGSTREKLLATGLIGYLGYIVYIGGDFMSGRFFSGLFIVGSMLLCKLIAVNRPLQGVVLALGLVLSLIAPYSPLNTLEQQPAQIINPATGVGNERAYYSTTWLVNIDRNFNLRQHKWAFEARYKGEKVPVIGGIGFYGFYAPRDLYIVDYFALTNPLLARLPIADLTDWRIGHFERKIPKGYLDTIETGANDLRDPQLYAFYEKLALITRGDIWSSERWQAIWAMNTGQYDYLLEHLYTTK